MKLSLVVFNLFGRTMVDKRYQFKSIYFHDRFVELCAVSMSKRKWIGCPGVVAGNCDAESDVAPGACECGEFCRVHRYEHNHPCATFGLERINSFVQARLPFEDLSAVEVCLLKHLPLDIITSIIVPYVKAPLFIEPLDYEVLGATSEWTYTYIPQCPHVFRDNLPSVSLQLDFCFSSFTIIFQHCRIVYFVGNIAIYLDQYPSSDFINRSHKCYDGERELDWVDALNEEIRQIPSSARVGFTCLSDYVLLLIRYCFVQLFKFHDLYYD